MLSREDKAWLRKTIRAEIDALLKDMIEGQQMGGYDGATEIKEDDWSEDGTKRKGRRIGFGR